MFKINSGKASLLAVIVSLGFTSFFLLRLITTLVFADAAQIGGEENGYSCVGEEDNRWKIEDGNSATLPVGYTFESVVVKAGQNCVPVYPTNTDPTCYSVAIVGQTVTVTDTEIENGSSCKDVSHLEGTYLLDPGSSPSPSPSPSVSPLPSPSSSPEPSPETSQSPSPESTPTPEVLSDVCANIDGIQTSVPDGLHLDASGRNCVAFELGGAPTPPPVTGQVLGATALGGTGKAEENIFLAFFTLGSILTAAGVRRLAAPKR